MRYEAGNMARFILILGMLVGAMAGCVGALQSQPAAATQEDRFRVLVFSKTAGFRHDCIPAGIDAIKSLGTKHGFDVDATEDAAVFTPENFNRYEVIVFMCTTGDVLNDEQQLQFERYMDMNRGGFVGIHAAADTEYNWPWYGEHMGAYFKSHPPVQEATVVAVEPRTNSTKHLPARWTRTDEWYNYRELPGKRAASTQPTTAASGTAGWIIPDNHHPTMQVLLRLDTSSYEGSEMGMNHPIAWQQEFISNGSRAWYTGLGHTPESYTEPLFLDHLAGGILWAAGRVD